MVRKEKRIHVDPGSQIDRLLAQVAQEPVLLERNGELYQLSRVQTEPVDPFRNYDPKKARRALRNAVGILADVDRDALLTDIHGQREQDSFGRPA